MKKFDLILQNEEIQKAQSRSQLGFLLKKHNLTCNGTIFNKLAQYLGLSDKKVDEIKCEKYFADKERLAFLSEEEKILSEDEKKELLNLFWKFHRDFKFKVEVILHNMEEGLPNFNNVDLATDLLLLVLHPACEKILTFINKDDKFYDFYKKLSEKVVI